MPATAAIPTPANRAAEFVRRHVVMEHAFSDPLLGTRYSKLTGNQKRIIALLDVQHREDGVTVFGMRNAIKVLGLGPEEIVATLDELNRAKMVFFVSFEMPGAVSGEPWVFYACKPFRQAGDVSMRVAQRIATRLLREDRA